MKASSNQTYPALVRDAKGNLEIKRYASSYDAMLASAGRELQTPRDGLIVIDATGRRKGYTVGRLAAYLGVSSRTIARRCESGELPHIDHGTAAKPMRIIPPDVVNLIHQRGLRGVACLMRSGRVRMKT